MSPAVPPSLPPRSAAATTPRDRIITRFAIILAGLAGVCVVSLIVLRVFGLWRPFTVPTGSMSPAIDAGDCIVTEGFTYLKAKPVRGDIMVFTTDGLPSVPGHNFYIKRLVGFPGDELRLANGTLYVNGKPVSVRNKAGEIHYVSLRGGKYLTDNFDTARVPDDHYFVLGDNSPRSADSRSFGFVPAKSVLGRAVFCYWPIWRLGPIQ